MSKKIDVLSLKGEKVKDIKLEDNIFNIEPNDAVVKDAIVAAMAGARQGTASVKTRAEVSGGGRKPYRQKGTGNARQGSIRASQYRHGGIAFGPVPRDYSKKMNKKEREIAIKSALSDKFQNKELIVVDNIKVESNKTKEILGYLNILKADAKTLIVTNTEDDKLLLATRNLENVLTINPVNINVLAVVNANSLVIDVDSVKKIEEVLK